VAVQRIVGLVLQQDDKTVDNMAKRHRTAFIKRRSSSFRRPFIKVIKPNNSVGYIYVVHHHGDIYKIGKTSDIDKRLKALKTGNPFIKLINSRRVQFVSDCESELHNKFAHQRISGEFFHLCDDNLRYIDIYLEQHRQRFDPNTHKALADSDIKALPNAD